MQLYLFVGLMPHLDHVILQIKVVSFLFFNLHIFLPTIYLVNKIEVKFPKSVALNIFASPKFACCWYMSPNYIYLLTPENCRCKTNMFPFLKPTSYRCCVWWDSMCAGVGIMVCWSCSDSACLQNQHFCLSWNPKDAQDPTDFLAFPISIAVGLRNPTQDRAVALLEAAQTNL